MFPLGSVLLPSALLPLHVFEPRYREMVQHCLAGTPEFGVVLIERGHEVGGGDVRTTVGTVARIVEAAEMEDGRWVLTTVGTRRIAVERWLDDDPWPQAEVRELDPGPDEPRSEDPSHTAAWHALRARLRQVLARAAEIGVPCAPATVELSPEPDLGSFQAAAVAPIGPADQQRVLAEGDVGSRLRLVGELLEEADEVLEARLAMAGDDGDDLDGPDDPRGPA